MKKIILILIILLLSFPIFSYADWVGTRGAGNWGESCIDWLRRTGQIPDYTKTEDLRFYNPDSGEIYRGKCLYVCCEAAIEGGNPLSATVKISDRRPQNYILLVTGDCYTQICSHISKKDCDTENYYYQTGTESPTGTEKCWYRDYEDAYCGCDDAGDKLCKDCTNYSDSLQYSCGTCKYISSANCTGPTQGCCSNYSSSYSCGTQKRYCTAGTNCYCSSYKRYCDTDTDKTCTRYCSGTGFCMSCSPPSCSTSHQGTDSDGDGYDKQCGDCDDGDKYVHPGATEKCVDGKDNDCDGFKDLADSDCPTDTCPKGGQVTIYEDYVLTSSFTTDCVLVKENKTLTLRAPLTAKGFYIRDGGRIVIDSGGRMVLQK